MEKRYYPKPTNEPKQETLEEASKQFFKGEYVCNGIDIAPVWREGFVLGANWMQERMYSEEEVEKIAKGAYSIGRNRLLIGAFNRWFEQFKKK